MSKWTSYSYINLSARGFDCLSYLACAIVQNGGTAVTVRQVGGVYRASASILLNLTFIPVADVKNGVKIRGDKLVGGGTGSAGVVSSNIVTYKDVSNIANYAPYYNGNTEGEYVYQHYTPSGTSILAGSGCDVAYSFPTLSSPRFLRGMYTQNAAASYVPFTWNQNTGKAAFKLITPVSEIKTRLKSIFETDFHGNEFSLDDSQTPPSLEFEMNCPPASYAQYYLPAGIYDSGDPITAPLFTIPFI